MSVDIYIGQVVTSAEARFNNSLHPRKPEGSVGRTAQDGHLDSHTAPELWIGFFGCKKIDRGAREEIVVSVYFPAPKEDIFLLKVLVYFLFNLFISSYWWVRIPRSVLFCISVVEQHMNLVQYVCVCVCVCVSTGVFLFAFLFINTHILNCPLLHFPLYVFYFRVIVVVCMCVNFNGCVWWNIWKADSQCLSVRRHGLHSVCENKKQKKVRGLSCNEMALPFMIQVCDDKEQKKVQISCLGMWG